MRLSPIAFRVACMLTLSLVGGLVQSADDPGTGRREAHAALWSNRLETRFYRDLQERRARAERLKTAATG